MIEKSVLDLKEDRIEAVDELLNIALHNPLILDQTMAELFKELIAELVLYERMGCMGYKAKVQELMDSDHALKSFLVSSVRPDVMVPLHVAMRSFLI